MKNTAFGRSTGLLAHPFSLGMMAVLLVNDHLLRVWWPSWWTGKLGDFAWLGFFPFALAAVLSWVLPRGTPRREQKVKLLAFGLTGGVFILAKTVPGFHALTVWAFQAVFGVPSTLVRDPSDLLALPALLAAWHLWQLAPDAEPAAAAISRRSAALRLLVLPAAAVLTIANSAMPDYGITCLDYEGGVVYARASYFTYTSTDGGLTWRDDDTNRNSAALDTCPSRYGPRPDAAWQELNAAENGLLIRYLAQEPIQSSSDGGHTWETAYQPRQTSNAVSAYVMKTASGNPVYVAGPHHAVADPSAGSVIFAMGHEGVLVRSAAGEWREAAVGPYQPRPTSPDITILGVVLREQIILALQAALLIFIILGVLRLRLSKMWMVVLLWVLVLLAGLAWLLVGLIFPPAASGYGFAFAAIGLLAAGILLVVLALAVGVDLYRRRDQRPLMLRMALFSLAGGALFFLPSLMWAFNLLSNTGWVIGMSLLLAAAALTASLIILPRTLRDTPNKRPPL